MFQPLSTSFAAFPPACSTSPYVVSPTEPSELAFLDAHGLVLASSPALQQDRARAAGNRGAPGSRLGNQVPVHRGGGVATGRPEHSRPRPAVPSTSAPSTTPTTSGSVTAGPVFAVPAFQNSLAAPAPPAASDPVNRSSASIIQSGPINAPAQITAYQLPRHPIRPLGPVRNSSQASLAMEQSHAEGQSDIAQQEAAARDFKPDLKGPLVGNKITSEAITAEYAKADATYVAKTLALPQTYSHYRPIQGDGNCGWRAIAFAYFETLIQRGDLSQLHRESTRLNSLSDYIQNVGGHDVWLFEDFVAETFALISDITAAMSSGQDAMIPLIEKFNDPATSPSVIYHMRLLASSWLKGNHMEFQPYIDVPLDDYVQGTIMPVDQEIDHISVRLLFDILLKPAGIVLEIAYLDRSEGSSVTVHRMPEEANGQDPATLGPTACMLYRPGHYDILYREHSMMVPPVPTGPTSIQVNRVSSFSHQHEIQDTMQSLGDFSTLDMSPLAIIPTFEPGMPLGSPPPSGPATMADPFAQAPQPTWIAPGYAEPIAAAPSAVPTTMPQHASPHQQHPMTIHPLRFSKYNFPGLPEMAESNNANYEPTFTTNTFKNSHFNIAHYSNNNFQPEMYKPESDELPSGRGGGRKKSG